MATSSSKQAEKRPSDQEILAHVCVCGAHCDRQYAGTRLFILQINSTKQEMNALIQKISELEMEKDEHQYVSDSLLSKYVISSLD